MAVTDPGAIRTEAHGLTELYRACNWLAVALHIFDGMNSPPRIVLHIAGRDEVDRGLCPWFARDILHKARANFTGHVFTGVQTIIDWPRPLNDDLRMSGIARGLYSQANGAIVLLFSDASHVLRLHVRGKDEYAIPLLVLLRDEVDRALDVEPRASN